MFKQAKTILLYYSMKDEVQTHSFIEKWSKCKQIVLPAVVGKELELRIYTSTQELSIGELNILEPIGETFIEYSQIDLAIIPGVAFDKKGNRLGRGKGYYDRLLPRISAPKVGICFSFQLVDAIPSEEFDVCMNKVITNPHSLLSEKQYQ